MTKNFPIKAKTLKGDALREYKKTITLNQIQKEVLIGTLLGDDQASASIPLRKGYFMCQFYTNYFKSRIYLSFI